MPEIITNAAASLLKSQVEVSKLRQYRKRARKAYRSLQAAYDRHVEAYGRTRLANEKLHDDLRKWQIEATRLKEASEA